MIWRNYYRSPQWRARRAVVLRRDGHRCRVDACRTRDDLQVHHARGRRWWSWWWDPTRHLVTVCEDCHRHIHARAGRATRGDELARVTWQVVGARPWSRAAVVWPAMLVAVSVLIVWRLVA